ncbi:MAG: phage baseplate assembly protein V [Firmicutes bacterium]|nr:phage baseplate assembly protein V [Bacillota bacterium]
MSITEIMKERHPNQDKIYGVVTGIVTNNKDPDGLGRVKVKIPRLSGEDESNWARVVTFMAGKERGAFFLPEVDDEVLVAFEYGDITMPYIIGALWNGVDKPFEANSDGKNNIRAIKSRSGHLIRLDDKDGGEKIEIIDKSGKNMLTIDTKSNKITIISEKDIELSATKGKVTIDAQEVEIKSSSNTKVEAGGNMGLKASGTMTVKGATVNIN